MEIYFCLTITRCRSLRFGRNGVRQTDNGLQAVTYSLISHIINFLGDGRHINYITSVI